jgi:methylthioribose-1-phosphate isomerase
VQVNGSHFRSIWLADAEPEVLVIDQTLLPFTFEVRTLGTVSETALAIHNMVVRGAPLIGATAACGLYLAVAADSAEANLQAAYRDLLSSRPTAVNLRWALDRMLPLLLAEPKSTRAELARTLAQQICDEDVATNSGIGDHGLSLISQAANASPDRAVNILTHCNAGWLATVDWGTALAPIFKAHDAGIPVHVWVDETRPRNQGASLTAWELGAHGIPHTVIADNAGGHLMQQGEIDLCIVGSDRTTRTGDVCNKIGTYLKALAAHDNGIPFYAALPSSTIDWTIRDGRRDIPIEERSAAEVSHISGRDSETGKLARVRIIPDDSSAANPAFDVTPRKYVDGIITERGIAKASEEALVALFPQEAQTRPI